MVRSLMSTRLISIAFATLLLGAGAFAVLRARDTPRSAPEVASRSLETTAGDTRTGPPELPPGHPPIGAGKSAHGPELPQASHAPSITWKTPTTWSAAANPTSMRLATYRVPRAAGDTEDAEVSVTRAGGTTDANIERWLNQFDDRGKDTRAKKDVRGLKVTLVEVSGTYLGGGMMNSPSIPHPGWALLGAVVEAPGTPYFVKVTGPAATVRSARAAFDALIDSLTPS
jgi:hypothetical protein